MMKMNTIIHIGIDERNRGRKWQITCPDDVPMLADCYNVAMPKFQFFNISFFKQGQINTEVLL